MNPEDELFASDFSPVPRPPEKSKYNRTYCFAFRDRRLLLLKEGDVSRLPSIEEAQGMGLNVLRTQYLGELKDISCYSMDIDVEEDIDTDDDPGSKKSNSNQKVNFAGLRELHGILEDALVTIAGKAVQIMEWDRNTLFCGRCGSTTSPKETERAKMCPECGYTIFPRISPAIIVLIEKGDKVLLARSPHFPSGRYSIIAGFVEPGESIEEAVVREVMEEVGISIRNISYFGSQPWPYPDSLMIGFTAEFADGDIQVDGVEIEEASWFSADEIPHVPGNDSISGRLIGHFIERHS